MSANGLGKFADGIASWRKLMAAMSDDAGRWEIFHSAASEIARYVRKGLDRITAVDELHDIATTHGLADQDTVQQIISDAFKAVEAERTILDDDEPAPPRTNGKHQPAPVRLPTRATPYAFPDPASMPRRAWIHGGHYVRTVVTATVAPGASGKTTLSLFEAVTMAVNGFRVWYLSGEDQRDEIDRRIAAHCQHHGITPEQLAGRLFVDDKTSFAFFIGKGTRTASVAFEEQWLEAFEHAIIADKIDVVILDPFIGFHAVPENDNGAIDQIVKRLGLIAFATGCCIELNHHVRKLGYGQTELTVEDTRGGSSIINAVRSGRVINKMSEREADLARVGYDKRGFYLRVDKGKRNLAPPEAATWFHLISVALPNGDNVQALEAWEFPAAFDGVSVADVEWVQQLLRERPRRASSQSEDWLGHYLGTRFGRDTMGKDGAIWANKIIGQWLRNKVFKKMPLRDLETRKPNVPFYVPVDFGAEATILPFRARDGPSRVSATDDRENGDDTTSN